MQSHNTISNVTGKAEGNKPTTEEKAPGLPTMDEFPGQLPQVENVVSWEGKKKKQKKGQPPMHPEKGENKIIYCW